MFGWIEPTFLYEKKKDSAVILRCFSQDGRVEIPSAILGLPVCELASYAFSAHIDAKQLSAKYENGSAWLYPQTDVDFKALRPLSGSMVEEIVLPESMQRVGRYCFYNCYQLKRLEFSGSLYDWGSGVFTGCHSIRELCVHMEAHEPSGLKQVLDELPEALLVELRAKSENKAETAAQIQPGNAQYARLSFPEFYEEGVENTPARILETHVHGSGILYRNCFQNKKFDFAQYDAMFPYARAQEEEGLLIALVLGRLRYPQDLGQRAKAEYEEYLCEHAIKFGRYFLDQSDEEGLNWFLKTQRSHRPEALLKELSEYALLKQNAKAQSR